ncbi:MAG: hypothetical protein CMG49_05735 [Candidatus Marinimicrobia bacterium]|nr:hypothetical protein [Candidatus Neomarinimicrobiota bacterium]
MKNFVYQKIINLFFMIFFTGLAMFFIISYDNSLAKTFLNYCEWLFSFLIGDYGLDSQSKQIIFFDFSNDASKFEIGPKYFNTIFLSIISLIICFIVSSILNYLIIVHKNIIVNKVAKFIKTAIEWLSSVHIIIICLFILSLFETNISNLIAIIMICIGTNAFFEISSSQFNDMSDLNSRDFIVAARAWGDNILKHMKRSLTIDSINQIMGAWMLFFSNVMIYEIIFQRSGLGYLLFEHFLLQTKTISDHDISLISEPNLFLAISMLVIITICTVNTMKNIIITYLMDYKR